MKLKPLFFCLPVMTLILAGCAIHQNVKPVAATSSKQICVIENPAVKEGFLQQYQQALQSKGLDVRMLPAGTPLTQCAMTSTYSANWRWDLALYMAYAEIRVYSDGRPAGSAVYDAMRGGANLGKFINAGQKIHDLVSQLFPDVPMQ